MKNPVLIPIVSEKAYSHSVNGVYIFKVPLNFNCNEVKDAVELQYDVTVEKVRTLIQDGKSIRFSKGKRRLPGTASRRDVKKAFVTLKQGDSIRVFDTQEQTEEKK